MTFTKEQLAALLNQDDEVWVVARGGYPKKVEIQFVIYFEHHQQEEGSLLVDKCEEVKVPVELVFPDESSCRNGIIDLRKRAWGQAKTEYEKAMRELGENPPIADLRAEKDKP